MIIIAVFFIFILLPAFVAYKMTFSKRNGGRFRKYHDCNPDLFSHEKEIREALSFLGGVPYTEEKIAIDSHTVLYGDYYRNSSTHTVIMAHGYSTLPMTNFCLAAEDLYKAGYNVLLIYERAHGKSSGKCSTLGIKEAEDIIRWADYVNKKYGDDIALYGISMGCTAILYSSDKLNSSYIKAMILDCGFESPYTQILHECRTRHMPGAPLMPFIRLFALLELHADIKKSVRDSLRQTDVPALFIHGEKDRTVPIEIGKKNYDSCKSEKKWIMVPDAPHAISYAACRKTISESIEAFLDRYMEKK